MIRSVEIAICTWNRSALLAQTLESIRRLEIPPDIEWRVVVVDNGSRDDTEDVLDEYAEILPLTALTEQEQGHTFARNRAISESKGDLILWTDDDVLVDPAWMKAYVEPASQQSEISFWGGRIVPVFPDGRPKWVDENWKAIAGCFAARDLGDNSLEFSEDCLPYGANFAIRGSVQRENLFDTKLGRRGEIVRGDDEIELLQRLLRSGHRGRWVPASRVEHQIPASRATTDYVFQYFVGQGYKLVAENAAWTDAAWRIRLAYLWHSFNFELLSYFASSPVWFAHLARAGLAAGQWRAMRLGEAR